MTPWYLQKPEASIIRWGFDWVGKKRGNENGGELLSAEEVSMVSKLEVSGAVIQQGLCYILIKILWLCSWGKNNDDDDDGIRAGMRRNDARDHAPLSSCSVPHKSDIYGIY